MLLISLHATLLAALLLALCGEGNAGSLTAVFAADIHYDQFHGSAKGYKCNTLPNTYGVHGCDTPKLLLEAAVADIALLKASYVFVCGNWLRHGMSDIASQDYDSSWEQVAKILANSTRESKAVVPAMGNTDVVPEYFLVPNEEQLRPMAVELGWSGIMAIDERLVFRDCGFFERSLDAVSFIVVNTMLWSPQLKPSLLEEADPCGQFAWLAERLNSSTKRVVIVGHIPPTVSWARAVRDGLGSNPMYLDATFQQRFSSLLSAHRSKISFALFGHTHMMSFIADESIGVPIILVPSIAPTLGNNPSYLLATIDDETWKVLKLQHRYYTFNSNPRSPGIWSNGADIGAALSIDFGNVSSMATVAARWQEPSLAAKFLEITTSHGLESSLIFPGGMCQGACIRTLFCSLRFADLALFESCVKNTVDSALERTIGAATIAFTVISVLILFGGMILAVANREVLCYSGPFVEEEAKQQKDLHLSKMPSKSSLDSPRSSKVSPKL